MVYVIRLCSNEWFMLFGFVHWRVDLDCWNGRDLFESLSRIVRFGSNCHFRCCDYFGRRYNQGHYQPEVDFKQGYG